MNHAITTLGELLNHVDDKTTRKHLVHALKRQIHIAARDILNPDPGPHDYDRLTRAEMELVRDGKKIAAIKAVRERTALGLRECKELVERYTQ